MNPFSRISRFVLIALLFATQCGLCAKPEAKQKPVKQLVAFYRNCKSKINDPQILSASDTLYARAKAANDRLMQIMAHDLRAAYFAAQNNEPHLVEEVQRIKQLCVNFGKQQFIYQYYFFWSNRLVSFYIDRDQMNAAVAEACKLLAEAEADDYKPALRFCYRLLADIYFKQFNYQLAYQNYTLALDIEPSKAMCDIVPEVLRMRQAECAMELGMLDTVKVILNRQPLPAVSSSHPRFAVHRMRLLYDLKTDDLNAAGAELSALEQLFVEKPSLKAFVANLYALRSRYYEQSGNYAKARDEALRVMSTPLNPDDMTLRQYTVARLGAIYWQLGDYRNACTYFRRYIGFTDSLRAETSRLATNDLSGILDRVRLENRTRELQLNIKDRRLENTYLIIGALAVLLVVGSLSLFYMVRFNRRLRSSEAVVIAQNEHLKASGEELRKAKERVERAYLMKNQFIQNMSHEVRTPLNSIVGFSQILATQFSQNDATAEYARIIELSSDNLLRLIDNLLDVAALDQLDELGGSDLCDFNMICRESLNGVQSLMCEGVALIFEPSAENHPVYCNAARVTQILRHLLQNAAKFTQQGEIILSYNCLPQEHLLRFEVSDSGIGISPENCEVIFERFVKLNSFSQGTGLGLSIARDIAQKLGGRLYVDTSFTQGCRMILELPYRPAAA